MKHSRALFYVLIGLFTLFLSISFSEAASPMKLRCSGFRKDANGFQYLIFERPIVGDPRVSTMDLTVNGNGGIGGFDYEFWGTPNGDVLMRTTDSQVFLTEAGAVEPVGRILACSRTGVCNPNSSVGSIRAMMKNWNDVYTFLVRGCPVRFLIILGTQPIGGPFEWATKIELECTHY